MDIWNRDQGLDNQGCETMVYDIANLHARHKLVVVMCDNAGENKSQEIQEFLESVGV